MYKEYLDIINTLYKYGEISSKEKEIYTKHVLSGISLCDFSLFHEDLKTMHRNSVLHKHLIEKLWEKERRMKDV